MGVIATLSVLDNEVLKRLRSLRGEAAVTPEMVQRLMPLRSLTAEELDQITDAVNKRLVRA